MPTPKPEREDILRLLLRSVYLKGHQDGNMKTTDLSWEDKIVKDINKLYKEVFKECVPGKKKRLFILSPTATKLQNLIEGRKEGYNTAIDDITKTIDRI